MARANSLQRGAPSEPLVKSETKVKRDGKTKHKRGTRGGSKPVIPKVEKPPARIPEDVKPSVVPQPTSGGTTGAPLPPPRPQPQQDARRLLNMRRERVTSGSNNISAPASQEAEVPRYASTDIRERQKGGWNPAPKRKIQVDSQAAPQSRRNCPGLGYHQPARDSQPLSGPSEGSGTSRSEGGSQSSSSRRDLPRRDSGEHQVSSST